MAVRSFLILCVVTLAMVAAAVAAVVHQDRPESVSGSGEPMLPNLLERLDGLSAIQVVSAAGTLTAELTEGGWGLKERAHYPVPFETVREKVLRLAALEKVEPKTTRADRYPRLGVEDPAGTGAKSRELRLLNAKDEVLAALIIGKPAFGIGGEGALYVRVPGEERAWAVRGGVDAGTEAREWVDRTLTDIAAESLASITVTHPGGETLSLVPDPAAEGGWVLKELPAGAQLKSADDVSAMAQTLAGLTLDDLRSAAEMTFGSDNATRARFVTRDGLSVALEVETREGERWVRLQAEVPPEPGNDTDFTAAAAAAERINQRTHGWIYRVPSWKVAPLERRLSELITP
ncbi:MAG: DUF4340 domain-containing protein [Defluviicoccus sp.]